MGVTGWRGHLPATLQINPLPPGVPAGSQAVQQRDNNTQVCTQLQDTRKLFKMRSGSNNVVKMI